MSEEIFPKASPDDLGKCSDGSLDTTCSNSSVITHPTITLHSFSPKRSSQWSSRSTC